MFKDSQRSRRARCVRWMSCGADLWLGAEGSAGVQDGFIIHALQRTKPKAQWSLFSSNRSDFLPLIGINLCFLHLQPESR